MDSGNRNKSWIATPNLPGGRVALCVIAVGHSLLKASLENRGVQVLEMPAHPRLEGHVASHPDMLLHHMGGNRVTIADHCQTLIRALEGLGFEITVSDSPKGKKYPDDIGLNSLLISRTAYCKADNLDSGLRRHYAKESINIQNVSQGYARCSCAVVDKRSLISADPFLVKSALANGLDVLMIRPGYIELKGYSYGFIGGACGLLDKGTLAFAGQIEKHPDCQKIKKFCRHKGVDVVSLYNGPIQDVGGIIPLMEYT